MKGSHSAITSWRRGRSSGAARLLYPLLGACLWAAVVGYKPVIIVHGLFDSSGDFKNLQSFINEVSGRGNILGVTMYIKYIFQGLTLQYITLLQALQLISPRYQQTDILHDAIHCMPYHSSCNYKVKIRVVL